MFPILSLRCIRSFVTLMHTTSHTVRNIVIFTSRLTQTSALINLDPGEDSQYDWLQAVNRKIKVRFPVDASGYPLLNCQDRT
jgi:hypothetical protein